MMTVFGMMFERHGRGFPVVNETSLLGQALAGNPVDPCNNVPYVVFEEVRTKFIAAIRGRRAGVVPRSE
jgi:hypothetical protein